MKFVNFVCIFVVLFACDAVMSSHFPALLEGNCQPEDLPPGVLGGCERITCKKDENGLRSISGVTCGVVRCPHGKLTTDRRPDLTKKYPDCCSLPECSK